MNLDFVPGVNKNRPAQESRRLGADNKEGRVDHARARENWTTGAGLCKARHAPQSLTDMRPSVCFCCGFHGWRNLPWGRKKTQARFLDRDPDLSHSRISPTCLLTNCFFLLHHSHHSQTVGTTGSTPLHFAAANGCLPIVEILLRHGAIPDLTDKASLIIFLSSRRP